MRRCTDITLILDRSGSMDVCKSAMEESLTAYINDQKRLPDQCVFSLVTFDDRYDREINAIPIKDVGKIEIKPRGSTALLYAIGRTITETGARLETMPENERPDRVLIVILTDGLNNINLPEYSLNKINEMIAHQTDKYNWGFIFIGAGQDAIASAVNMGIHHTNALSVSLQDPTGARGSNFTGKKMSSVTAAYRTAQHVNSCNLVGAAVSEKDVDDEYAKAYGGKGAFDVDQKKAEAKA
jgi:uncharacterized protein YegL